MRKYAAIMALLIGITLTVGCVVSALSAGQNDGPVDTSLVVGRIVQKHGTVGNIIWSSQDVTGVSIDADTVLPQGMTAEVQNKSVIIHCDANDLGVYEATFVLHAWSLPNVNNWTGPPIERIQTGRIIWYVFPGDDSPFMNGLGDVLVP